MDRSTVTYDGRNYCNSTLRPGQAVAVSLKILVTLRQLFRATDKNGVLSARYLTSDHVNVARELFRNRRRG